MRKEIGAGGRFDIFLDSGKAEKMMKTEGIASSERNVIRREQSPEKVTAPRL